MILGLDASSSVIGYTVLDDDGKLVDIGFVDLKPFDDLYLKLEFFREFLLEFDKKYGVDVRVYIEEPLMMFGKGKSMAQVISKLQRWNGMLSGAIYSDFNLKPVLINASHARKLCGIKLIRGQNTKEIVLSYVRLLNVVPEGKWILKKTGKYKDFCFDMADSYIIALAGMRNETNEQKKSI